MIIKATKYVHLPLVLAKNELIEVVDSVDLENADRAGLRYYLEISVRKAANSADFVVFRTLKGSEKPPRVVSGATYYDGFQPFIDEYLNGLLSYGKPDMGKPVLASKTTTAYKLRSWAERDGVLVAGSEVVNSVRWAIKAALGENDFPRYKNSFFGSYMDEHLPFLTHQPNEMLVSVNQLVNLSWLCNVSPVPGSVSIRVKRRCSDGGTYYSRRELVAKPSQYGVYHIPVGFEQLNNGEETSAPVVQYEVWLEDDELRRISEIRRFIVDRAFYAFDRTLFFSNNLGGFDSLRFTGTSESELSLNVSLGERATGANDTAADGNAYVLGKDGERVLKMNTGTVTDPEWLNYMEELAWAEQVYLAPDVEPGMLAEQVSSGRLPELKPLVLRSNKYVPRVDNEDIGSREFEFVAAKNAVATNMLPTTISGIQDRPTVWIAKGSYCLIDANGKQTGMSGAAKLELHYSDVQPPVPVKGVALKDNEEGTDGYVPPVASPSCVVGYAAFTNVAISKLGSFKKQGCGAGYVGVAAMVTVEAGLFSGSSQKIADDLAAAEWSRRNTQAAADANVMGCSYVGVVGVSYDYSYTVPAGKAHFRWSSMRVGSANADNYVVKSDGSTNKGNGWPIFVSGDPDIFMPGTNDIDLPVAFATSSAWQFGVYGKGFGAATTVRIYVNGVQVATATSTEYFFSLEVPHASIGAGARVFVRVV
jgi:hypothetical protein